MDVTELDLSEYLESEEREERSKKLIAESEAFMKSCGKDDLEVYRIEKFTPTPQPKDTYGKFHEGDSYVVVRKNEKEYEIHYWHGKECTADEMGSSAAFTVQLSGVLPLPSNHHLEEQLYEGEVFLSYFKKTGVEYLPGGIESGFNIVTEKEFVPRLLHCKGERYPRVFSVEMKADSINEGDVFILDMNDKIYFWPGEQCNVTEKMKGLEVATNMRKSERHAQADIYFPREDEKIDAEFWGHLGGKPDKINPPTPDADAEAGSDEELNYKFYKISNETGKLLCTEVTERPLKKEHLDTNDTFILELSKHVYIWIGRGANVEEKKNALIIGKSFLKAHNKPKGTRVTRVVEKAEDVHFKSFFDGFYPILKVEHGASLGFDTSVTANQDMDKVANKKREAVDKLLTKLGKYSVKVYLNQNDENVEIPEQEYGHFFQDNVYTIDVKGENHRYLVQWFGPRLPSDQVSEFRQYLNKLTDNIFSPREITRISVMQGHEDDTLLTFFPHGFICHDGPRLPFSERLEKIKSNGCLFKIQGPFGEKPQAIEQDQILCEKLNSNEAFFVVAKGGEACYYWIGEGASEDEAAYAQKLGAILCPGASQNTGFKEGEETDDFWASLGGKTTYSSIKEMGIAPGFEPRLFHCSNCQGYFHMKEIYNFQQTDLNNNDVMVLDVYSTIYIWVGRNSNEVERKNVIKKVEKYVENITDGRDK